MSAVLTPRLAIFLVIGLASACSGSTERAVSDLVREGGIFLDPETRRPFSGLAFATYQEAPSAVADRLGDRVYEGPFENLRDGRRLSSREAYTRGVKHGPYQWFFENGQVFEEGTYVEGRLDGPYRAYWETGALYEEGTYRRGRFDGPRRWYMNGRLVEVVTYRLGEMDGLYERYDTDGEMNLKGMLLQGDPCGTWIEGDRMVSYTACAYSATQ